MKMVPPIIIVGDVNRIGCGCYREMLLVDQIGRFLAILDLAFATSDMEGSLQRP